jgi:oligopeptide transport system substrate-binding protein
MSAFVNALFHWKRAFHFLGILALVCIASNCSRREQRADLVLLNGAEPQSLDPHIVTGQPDGRVSGCMFEGLLQFDPKTGDPVPAIAERYDVSPDAKVYTFHLRTNALWSNGERITAEDFVYSWRRALDPRTGADYAMQLFQVWNAENFTTGATNPTTGKRYTAEDVGVRAIDDRTLEVKLVAAVPFFLDQCAFRTLCVVPRKSIEKYGDRWVRAPDAMFSGPFMLESWRVNDRIRVKKNPRYWDAGKVEIQTADWLPFHEPNLNLNTFLRGDGDVIFDKRRVPAELLDVLRKQPYTHDFQVLASFFTRFNVTRKPFDDVRVRRAMVMAIDKSRITTRITRGGEKTATYLTPPGITGYEPAEGITYNPDGARKLLRDAGFPNGQGFPVFRYMTPNTVQGQQTAVELRDMWDRELGIKMEIQPIEWKVFLGEQSRTNFDLSYSSWIGDYKDPNTFLDMFMRNSGNNRTGWASARYDALMRKANSNPDRAKRFELLAQAEAVLCRDEVPIMPLYFEKGILFFDPEKIEGIYPNLIDEHPISAMRRKKPRDQASSR